MTTTTSNTILDPVAQAVAERIRERGIVLDADEYATLAMALDCEQREIVPTPTRESHCSCGRWARQVLDGGHFGPTGYCGASFKPLDPCDCGHVNAHDRSVCHVYGMVAEQR